MDSDGHYQDGVEGTIPPPETTFSVDSDPHWKQVVEDSWKQVVEDRRSEPDTTDETECTVCNILSSVCGCTDETDAIDALEIQTFTITRVIEFDGVESRDLGFTIEFYGACGPITTMSMSSSVAAALTVALAKGVV